MRMCLLLVNMSNMNMRIIRSLWALAFAMIWVSCLGNQHSMNGNDNEMSSDGDGKAGDEQTITQNKDTLTIAMSGDTMFGTDFPETKLAADDGKQLLKHTAAITREADIAIGNLEGVFCTNDVPPNNPDTHFYSFRFPARYAPRLVEAGYDFMCMANNHAYDFREEGIRQTKQVLDEHQIAHSGIKGEEGYVLIEKQGVKFGVCAFGHNWYTIQHTDFSNIERVLAEARPKCDILVVTFHGGAEGRACRHLPEGEEFSLNASRGKLRQMAHYCIDHGADVVFGHGPHVVRAIELYKDRLIAYSLGNFCTPYSMSISDITGYAPLLVERVDREGKFIDAKIHSFIQQPGIGPQPDKQCLVAKEIRSLTESDIENSQLTITDDGYVSRKR